MNGKDTTKTITTYQAALHVIGTFKNQTNLKVMDVTEDSTTTTFLQAEKPHQVIHTAFEGSQVVQLLTAMGEEELLEVAKEELSK